MTDGTGTTSYAYHPFGALGGGQLASVDGPLANDTVSYAYDELGRVKTRSLTGVTTTWNYDAQGRLGSLVDPIGTFTYTYVGVTGRVSSVSYPNGQTSSYAYLPVNQDLRLQEIHHKRPGGATLNKFNYSYDAVGNIATWSQQTDSNPAQVYEFGYDRVDQLTAATLKNAATQAVLKRYRYAYDPAGNRSVEQIDDTATGASYDNMNRLSSQVPGGAMLFRGTTNEPASVTVQGKPALTTPGNEFAASAPVAAPQSDIVITATDYASPTPNLRTNTYRLAATGPTRAFTYDANGNLTGDGVKTYEWDAENRLIAVNQGTPRSEFTYDGARRRVRIVEKANSVVTSDRRFVWCGSEICEGGNDRWDRRHTLLQGRCGHSKRRPLSDKRSPEQHSRDDRRERRHARAV